MNMTGLLLSLLFGTIGMGYLMYGKRMGEFTPIGVGLGLMVIPYFISSNLLLVLICVGLMAVPFFYTDG